MTQRWFLYLLLCADGTHYTGITTDPHRRLARHNDGKGGAYTRCRRPVRMAVLETHLSRSSAQKREAEVRSWTRDRKHALWVAGWVR